VVMAVLIVGLANFALGFSVAWAIERAGVANIGALLRALRTARPSRKTPAPSNKKTVNKKTANEKTAKPETAKEQTADAPPSETAPYLPPADVVAEPTAELPSEWLNMLSEVEECKAFVEASAATLRLEVGRYRDLLIDIDRRVRRVTARAGGGSAAQILIDLATTNANWMERQVVAARSLQSRRGNSGTLAPEGRRLEAILADQTKQIKTAAVVIESLDFQADFAAAGALLLQIVGALLDRVHSLRDAMHGALVAITVADDRLESIDKKLHTDGLTGLVNRSGFECKLQNLWRDDPDRKRPFAAAMIDIDSFSRINDEFGVPIGDRFLAAFGSVLAQSVAATRPSDTLVRFEGQRFIVLAVDASAQQLLDAIEPFRQTIAAAAFEFDQRPVALTASCGLTDAQPLDTSATLVARLHAGVRHAKQSRRNCTCIELAGGSELIDALPCGVEPSRIRVT
jgi:diguanylate cyclase (GGDEF)-like protein